MRKLVALYYADNGFILSYPEEDEISSASVYEVLELDDGYEAFAGLLRDLVAKFGPSDGRYSEKRIYVEIRSGDKYNDYKNQG